jgi:hypothetical protein
VREIHSTVSATRPTRAEKSVIVVAVVVDRSSSSVSSSERRARFERIAREPSPFSRLGDGGRLDRAPRARFASSSSFARYRRRASASVARNRSRNHRHLCRRRFLKLKE